MRTPPHEPAAYDHPPSLPPAKLTKARVAAAMAGDELSESESEDDEGGDQPPPTPAYARAFFDDSINQSSEGSGSGGGVSKDPGDASNAVGPGGGGAGRGGIQDEESGVSDRDKDMMAKGLERDAAIDEMEKERRKCREKDAERLSDRLVAVSAEVSGECVTTDNKSRGYFS